MKQRAAAPLELELLLPPLPLGLGIFTAAFPTQQPSQSLTEWSSASRFGDLVWSAQNGTVPQRVGQEGPALSFSSW